MLLYALNSEALSLGSSSFNTPALELTVSAIVLKSLLFCGILRMRARFEFPRALRLTVKSRGGEGNRNSLGILMILKFMVQCHQTLKGILQPMIERLRILIARAAQEDLQAR